MNRSLEINELAIKLADESARSGIDSCSPYRTLFNQTFYDISELPGVFAKEIRYLELRGLLERHPTNPNWVQLFEEVADEAVPIH